jgi:1,4-dihydroxy-2-naphthoyl-CoA hydrolase
MFSYEATVQLYHTDSYGIIFFANQFKFCHDAFQAFLDQVGLPLAPQRPSTGPMLVIVHAESDYKAPIRLGDRLRLELRIERLGTTSVTVRTAIANQRSELVGLARTVHVTIDAATSAKVPLPDRYRIAFAPHVG